MKQKQRLFFALGTANSISVVYEESQEDQVEACLDEIENQTETMDDLWSVFKKTSEISQINALAGEKMVKVSPETMYILKESIYYSELTKGAFDITTQPLTSLWREHLKKEELPDKQDILRALMKVDYHDILIDEEKGLAMLRKKGQAIDLGSIAKGYLADQAKETLLSYQLEEALINFGGTVIALGKKKTTGIQNPFMSLGTSMGQLDINNQAVVTSGAYEHYTMIAGVRYHHLIHPQTGMPVENSLISVTLIGESAMALDAFTTALFVEGMQNGYHYLNEQGLSGVFITEDGQVYMSETIKNDFKIKEVPYGQDTQENIAYKYH